jgi:hypothetical protein
MQAVAAPSKPLQTVIAHALYTGAPPVNFVRLVAMLQARLKLLPRVAPDLSWDCDDVAMFRMSGLRVMLALTDAPGTDYACCITIGVGPDDPTAAPCPLLRRTRGLCRAIADSLAANTQPAAMLWNRVTGVLTAERIDDLVWRLSDSDLLAFALPPVDLPDAPRNEARELRQAMYRQHELANPVSESLEIRLATQAANSTLLVAAPPVGAAMFAMSILRGENPRLTARVMALTGAGIALVAILQQVLGLRLL